VESVTATDAVRRTVRLAVALVMSQALLCGVIGWLTIGGGHDDSSGSQVDRLAVPTIAPAAPPAPAMPSTAAPSHAAAAASAAGAAARKMAKSATRDPEPVVTTAQPRSPAAPPPAPAGPVEPTAAPPAPPPAGLVPPSPTPSVEAQQPVEVGDLCRPEWAFGRTVDGTVVRCLRTGSHRPRWKIV
jgi:hypothetical protein